MTATADSQVLPEWIAAAECTRVDPETFFPIGRDSALAEPAKAICRRCAAIRECLAYALVVDVQGVWGGTSDSERAALRLRHGIVSEPISLNLPVSLFDSATAIDDRGGGFAQPNRGPDGRLVPHGFPIPRRPPSRHNRPTHPAKR